MRATIALLPGDGIGPEVIDAAARVLDVVARRFGHDLDLARHPIGGTALRAGDPPLPDATRAACRAADAVLLGAVGDPEFDHGPSAGRPETGLLQLRKELAVFANLRPARMWPGLEDGGSLKPDRVRGLDMLIVRELTGGLYYGEPRGRTDDGQAAFNTMRYARPEIERIAVVAFESARQRRGLVTSVDKANVLDTSRLWREVVTEVGARYPDVRLEHQYVDSCALLMVTDPQKFDVAGGRATCSATSFPTRPAASSGRWACCRRPAWAGGAACSSRWHGSAPDIAGRNVANPLAAIASAAMLLRHALGADQEADVIERAIGDTLAAGAAHRGSGCRRVGRCHILQRDDRGRGGAAGTSLSAARAAYVNDNVRLWGAGCAGAPASRGWRGPRSASLAGRRAPPHRSQPARRGRAPSRSRRSPTSRATPATRGSARASPRRLPPIWSSSPRSRS